jgi:hypothetical protein
MAADLSLNGRLRVPSSRIGTREEDALLDGRKLDWLQHCRREVKTQRRPFY